MISRHFMRSLRDIGQTTLFMVLSLSGSAVASAASDVDGSHLYRAGVSSAFSSASDEDGASDYTLKMIAQFQRELDALSRALDVIERDVESYLFCHSYLSSVRQSLTYGLEHRDHLLSFIPSLTKRLAIARERVLHDAPTGRTWSHLARAFTLQEGLKLPRRYVKSPVDSKVTMDVDAIKTAAWLSTFQS